MTLPRSKEHEAIRQAVGEAMTKDTFHKYSFTVGDVEKVAKQIMRVCNRRKIKINVDQ